MLPLLKRFTDDIRAAHLDVIERSPPTLQQDMAVVEQTFCEKLIKELEQFVSPSVTQTATATATAPAPATAPATATPPTEHVPLTQTEAVTASPLMYMIPLPTLQYLKDVDAKDSSIIDAFIVLDIETPGVTHFERVLLHDDCSPEYIIWLIVRGFRLPEQWHWTHPTHVWKNVGVLCALHERGVKLHPELPLTLANQNEFATLVWVLENVQQDWAWANEVLLAAVTAKNSEAVKCICKHMDFTA